MNTRTGASAAHRCSIALALALSLGGCALLPSAPPDTFDLTAPAFDSRAAAGRGVLIVAEPTAIQAIDSNRIVARTGGGQVTYVADAQWSDRLPQLLQERLVQAFENAGRLGSVGRPGDRLTPDYQLLTDIRTFEVRGGTAQAVIELSVKIVSDQGGRILAGQIFTGSAPAGAINGPTASAALNQALAQVLGEVVKWVGSRI